MSKYDEQYLAIGKNILNHGYFDQNRTGIKTWKLPHQIMQFDLASEFPILTTKFVAFKTAVKEMLWIYQSQSNDVTLLQDQGIHIWDSWAREDNTIGESYGFVVKKYNQIDNLLETLRTNPQNRRMMINLWQIPHLPECNLPPCCFLSMFDVTDGKLNCMLVQRSADWGLGVPFNTSQFSVLTHMLAQSSGLNVGTFTHVINNAHIYENQIEGLTEQFTRPKFDAPKLIIKNDTTDFYAFKADDFVLENYQHAGKLDLGKAAI